VNIRDLFRQLRVDFADGGHHHTRPGWVQLRVCPFCRSGNYHLGYNLGAGYFNCWKCGSHSIYDTLKELGASGQEAATFAKTKYREQGQADRVRKGLKEPGGRGPLLPAHREYLRSRGFDPDELAKVWQLEGIGISDRLAWTIYIPITLHSSRVSWTTRTISKRPDIKRYLSASVEEEAVNHKSVLYGGDFCRHSCVVVEGPTDAWAVGPGAVGVFGIDYSVAQVRKLAEIPNRCICFDSEPEAQKRAAELCDALSVFDGVTTNVVLDADDPGSASQREIELLRRAAKLD